MLHDYNVTHCIQKLVWTVWNASPEHHEILHHLLPQIVVYTVDLILTEKGREVCWQFLRGLQIPPKRFFHNHPAPAPREKDRERCRDWERSKVSERGQKTERHKDRQICREHDTEEDVEIKRERDSKRKRKKDVKREMMVKRQKIGGDRVTDGRKEQRERDRLTLI